MTLQGQGAVASSKRQNRWAALLAIALVLGVGVGWFYARSAGLPRGAHTDTADSIAKLIIVLATTLGTSEVVRLGRQLGFWRASNGMLPAVLVTYSRALPPQERMARVLAIVVTGLWLASWFAYASRQQRTALWCIGLCGGLAASVVVATWSTFRAAACSLSP
jgi:hypothetical protein